MLRIAMQAGAKRCRQANRRYTRPMITIAFSGKINYNDDDLRSSSRKHQPDSTRNDLNSFINKKRFTTEVAETRRFEQGEVF